MDGINKVSLQGNLGKDPEFRVTQHGKEVAYLSLATSKTGTNAITNQYETKTVWHTVIVASEKNIALLKRHAKTGTRIYIEGSISSRKIEDPKFKMSKMVYEIHSGASDVMLLLDKYTQTELTFVEPLSIPVSQEDNDDVPF